MNIIVRRKYSSEHLMIKDLVEKEGLLSTAMINGNGKLPGCKPCEPLPR